MLWGSCPARIDDKFRLKIPAKFRRELSEAEDNNYYVTSDDGRRAQIFPISVWERVAQKFQDPPGVGGVLLGRDRAGSVSAGTGFAPQQDDAVRAHLDRLEEQRLGDAAAAGDSNHHDLLRNVGSPLLQGLIGRVGPPVAQKQDDLEFSHISSSSNVSSR